MENFETLSKLNNLRLIRNILLEETDRCVTLVDYFSQQEIEDIKVWRQSLRDAPNDVNVDDIVYGLTFSKIPAAPQSLIDKRSFFAQPSILRSFLNSLYYQQNPQSEELGSSDR